MSSFETLQCRELLFMDCGLLLAFLSLFQKSIVVQGTWMGHTLLSADPPFIPAWV